MEKCVWFISKWQWNECKVGIIVCYMFFLLSSNPIDKNQLIIMFVYQSLDIICAFALGHRAPLSHIKTNQRAPVHTGIYVPPLPRAHSDVYFHSAPQTPSCCTTYVNTPNRSYSSIKNSPQTKCTIAFCFLKPIGCRYLISSVERLLQTAVRSKPKCSSW